MSGGTAPSSILCPALVRSETFSTFSSASIVSIGESPGTLARRRSLAEMLQDDAEDPRIRSIEGALGEEEGLARPSSRRRSDPEHYQLSPPLVLASREERGPREVHEPTPPSQLKSSSSREKLQRLMSAPVIDWEKVRKAQENHYEKQAQRSCTVGSGLASRRNLSMYSGTPSHMRRSIERLDEAVTGQPKKQPNHQPQRRQLELRAPTDAKNLQRNASWCFSNGVVVRDKRLGLARRGQGISSARTAGLTLRRRKPSAPGGLTLAKPQVRRQGGNASWSLPTCEPGMAPPLSPAAKKAAWDMEVKATLDAAKTDLLQGQL